MPPVTCRCTPPPWQTPGQETPPESHPKSLLRIGAALQHAVKQQPLSEALPVISHSRVGGQVTQVLQCAPVPPLLPCPVQTHGLAPAQHLQQGSVPLTQSVSSQLGAGRWHLPQGGRGLAICRQHAALGRAMLYEVGLAPHPHSNSSCHCPGWQPGPGDCCSLADHPKHSIGCAKHAASAAPVNC